MNITNEQYMTIIRSLLKFGGGFAVARGLSSSNVELISGLVTTIAGMSWSWFVHTPAEVVKAAEVVKEKGLA